MQDYPHASDNTSHPCEQFTENNCVKEVFSVTYCRLLTTNLFSPSLTLVTLFASSHSQELFGIVAWWRALQNTG